MSNIFSNRKYALPNGVVLDVPRGISIGRSSRDRYIYASVRIAGKLTRFEGLASKVIVTIRRAVELLKKNILAGYSPGGYHMNKRSGTDSDNLPTGLTIRYLPTCDQYRIYISYPDVEKEKLGHTNYYIGTEETYAINYDVIVRRAMDFRRKKLTEYRNEFIRRLNDLLSQLRELENVFTHQTTQPQSAHSGITCAAEVAGAA